MMKFLSLVFLVAIFQTSYCQTATKNEEQCKIIESNKNVQRLNAIFEISNLNPSEQNELMNFLYQGNHYIYKVNFNQNNTINIYHIDAVKVDFIKDLLVQFNCYIDLKEVLIVQQISRQ